MLTPWSGDGVSNKLPGDAVDPQITLREPLL